MKTAFYTADDFFSSDYPFDSFPLLCADGSLWIHDDAQGQRVKSPAFAQCEKKIWPSEYREEWGSAGLAPHELLPALQQWSQAQDLKLLLLTGDAVLLEQAHALGIRCGEFQQRFNQALDTFHQADNMYNIAYAESSQLEQLLSQHLIGRAFEDYEGEMSRIQDVRHMEIAYGEEDGNSAITPTTTGADVRKYFYVKALAAPDTETEATLRRFKIWVHARMYMEGGAWRFTLLGVEG